MGFLRAFIAAFLATLIFHQGLLALLHAGGVVPAAPYNTAATWPFGVPQYLSLAFWGGVWGLVLWALVRHSHASAYWLRSLIIGAIGPTAVAMLVVFPLKGVPIGMGKLVVGLLLNGVWGVGTAALILPLRHWLPGR